MESCDNYKKYRITTYLFSTASQKQFLWKICPHDVTCSSVFFIFPNNWSLQKTQFIFTVEDFFFFKCWCVHLFARLWNKLLSWHLVATWFFVYVEIFDVGGFRKSFRKSVFANSTTVILIYIYYESTSFNYYSNIIVDENGKLFLFDTLKNCLFAK